MPLAGPIPRAAAAGLQVNPSDETIRLGPLWVRFLITAENSIGSVAAFEVLVPAAQRLAAPAHSHDHYEETIYGISGVLTGTVNGRPIDVGPGQALCIRAAPFIASIITASRM
jgi:quercetin dioxygenase-like cupin family protein